MPVSLHNSFATWFNSAELYHVRLQQMLEIHNAVATHFQRGLTTQVIDLIRFRIDRVIKRNKIFHF